MKLSETSLFAANFRIRDVGAGIFAQVLPVMTSVWWVFRSLAGFLRVGAELVPQERPCCHDLGLAQWVQVGIAPTDRAMRRQA